jgi:hypothetical protein
MIFLQENQAPISKRIVLPNNNNEMAKLINDNPIVISCLLSHLFILTPLYPEVCILAIDIKISGIYDSISI